MRTYTACESPLKERRNLVNRVHPLLPVLAAITTTFLYSCRLSVQSSASMFLSIPAVL